MALINTAGLYCVSYNIGFTSNSSGSREFYISINGGSTAGDRYGHVIMQAANGPDTFQTGSELINLSVNDYVEIFVYQTSGGNLNILQESTIRPCHMSIYRVGTNY